MKIFTRLASPAAGLLSRPATSAPRRAVTTTINTNNTAYSAPLRIASLARHLSTTTTNMAPITKEADYVVLGGGSGGLASARAAASKFGARAVIVENKRLGGTCVNVGCVPKKVTYNAAALAEAIHDAKAYGFSVDQTAPFDWPAFKRKRDAYIERLNGIYERNLGNDKVEYLRGYGRLLSRNEAGRRLQGGGQRQEDTRRRRRRPHHPPLGARRRARHQQRRLLRHRHPA